MSFLDRGRVALAPGVNYGPRSGVGHVRLNFGTSAEPVGDMVQRTTAACTTLPT